EAVVDVSSSSPTPQDNKNLQQLEQECLQFFESTIDSLEESFEDGEEQSQQALTLASAPSSSLMPVRSSSPGAFFNPAMPGTTQSLAAIPSSHQEMKPRQEPGDMKASEYNPPLPSGSSYRTPDGRSSYCPPGCVPTPVLIAQKLAENQGGPTSNIGPSSLHHRKSFESDKPTSLAEQTVKYGPPTSSKPTRFPTNINVVHSNKEANQTNVNIHERQAQMLANLPGASQYPGQEEMPPPATQKGSNLPSRSVSFRDPTPSKSRMEALYGGRTVTINPSAGSSPQARTARASAPSTAPKPLRQSSSGNLHRPRATSPEARRKSTTSKPAAAFRAQGITVQFSGKGGMDDSRRAALRKLGLMK
uniref:Proline and serine rich 2 n=1 Tax=Gadus morhua TaxID=8049 RepID=A0A8C4Z4C8_GADMO